MTYRSDNAQASFFFFYCLFHLFVVFAPLQFHVDKKGRVNYVQTDMLIHVVNNQTNTILDVDRYGGFCATVIIGDNWWSGLTCGTPQGHSDDR